MQKPDLKKRTGDFTKMKVPLEDLQKAAAEFKSASEETDQVIRKLEKVVKRLEDSWDDQGQQIFFKYYQEWHTHISGFSQLLDAASMELYAIAQRYSDADSDSPSD